MLSRETWRGSGLLMLAAKWKQVPSCFLISGFSHSPLKKKNPLWTGRHSETLRDVSICDVDLCLGESSRRCLGYAGKVWLLLQLWGRERFCGWKGWMATIDLLPCANCLLIIVPSSCLAAFPTSIRFWWVDHRNEARKLERGHPPIEVSVVFVNIFSSLLRVKSS